MSCFFSQRKKHVLVDTATSAFVITEVTKQTSTGVHRDVKQPIVLKLSSGKLTLPAETPPEYLVMFINGLPELQEKIEQRYQG